MVIVGRTKLPYNDLYILSRPELDAILEGHEIERKDDWERARMSSYWIVSPYNDKHAKPNKLFPLPWDKIELPDIEEMKERLKKAKDIFNRYGKTRN